ncbi:MAG: hypothetical protein K6E19_05600 [Lachnospiraceae bacterium]|nr:hypothetical protein [Lachnospiraceae bacterium]
MEALDNLFIEIVRDEATGDFAYLDDIEENLERYGEHLAVLSDGLFDRKINNEIVAFPGELPSLMITDDHFGLEKSGLKVDPILITYEKTDSIDEESECFYITVSVRLDFDSKFSNLLKKPLKEWNRGPHISQIDADDQGSVFFFHRTTEYGEIVSAGAVELMLYTLSLEVKDFISIVKNSLGR